MVSDIVVAIVPEDVLSGLLSQIHRAGLGQTARVLRPHRHPIQAQLERAGIAVAHMPMRVNDAATVLTVMAAGRSVNAANLALQAGASAVWIVTRVGEWAIIDDHDVADPIPGTARPTPAPTAFLPVPNAVEDAPD